MLLEARKCNLSTFSTLANTLKWLKVEVKNSFQDPCPTPTPEMGVTDKRSSTFTCIFTERIKVHEVLLTDIMKRPLVKWTKIKTKKILGL